MEPQHGVARTYDAVAAEWQEWADGVRPPIREKYANVIIERLRRGSRVLEIGCGTGKPVAALLAQHFEVSGVDISPEMISLAQQAVPTGHFVVADIATVHHDDASFDGVVAFYSLIHLPRDLQVTIFSRIYRWLVPGGILVASLGTSDLSGDIQDDWLGAGSMYWSSYDAKTNQSILRNVGFTLEQAEVIAQVEPLDNDVSFLWVVTSKPA